MIIRRYETKDIGQMISVWNEVVEEGNAFPQEEPLDEETGSAFFASQSFCGVADDGNGHILANDEIQRLGLRKNHICKFLLVLTC